MYVYFSHNLSVFISLCYRQCLNTCPDLLCDLEQLMSPYLLLFLHQYNKNSKSFLSPFLCLVKWQAKVRFAKIFCTTSVTQDRHKLAPTS